MAVKIKDLGMWVAYKPDRPPDWAEGVPPGMRIIYARRESDGADWYEFRAKEGAYTEGYLLATTSIDPASNLPEIVQGVHRDRSEIAVPVGMRVIEIEDVSPDDLAPWKPYEGRTFDPATLTIGDPWAPPIMAVRDYQFAGQAAAEGIIGDDDALEWITVGKTPDKLISAVKEKVADPDRQKRVLLFLAGTTTFPRFHELTPLLAGSFGKNTPEKVDAFFLAASQR